MADLQQALAARERRSRIITIVIGILFFALLAFLLIRLNSNDNNQVADNENGVEQSEGQNEEMTLSDILAQGEGESNSDSEGEAQPGVDLNDVFGSETPEEPASTPAPVAPSTTESTTKGGETLPSTGPEDAALLGMFAIVAGVIFYRNSRQELSYSLLNK